MSVTPALGGTSSPNRLKKLDGRTREAKRLRKITRELTDQVGGAPSAAQKILIQRVAVDVLRLELLDAEMAEGTFSAHDSRVAHALRNSVRLALRDLSAIKVQKPQRKSLVAVLAEAAARETAG